MRNVGTILWKWVCSLKSAVVVMCALTVSLIVATVLESVYDTPTAQYHVYQSGWFYGILTLLGINILCVALDRLPWKRNHVEFLMAHAGILLLLVGSYVTMKFGIDGMMEVEEGGSSNIVEFQKNFLVSASEKGRQKYEIPWSPPHVSFKPFAIPDLGVVVSKWIPHAERSLTYEYAESKGDPKPALRVKLQGGPNAPPVMKLGADTWLWSGDLSRQIARLGPVNVTLRAARGPVQDPGMRPWIDIHQLSSRGTQFEVSVYREKLVERKKITIKESGASESLALKSLKFEISLSILEFVPDAKETVSYEPSQTQYGTSAPPGAIYLEPARLWLGLGDRGQVNVSGNESAWVAFVPERMILPFEISLHQFLIEYYQGSRDPKGYASRVDLMRGKEQVIANHTISMNEPLSYRGYTFYQASYRTDEGAPPVTVLSVNRDPGRSMKYSGSALLVLGSVALFLRKVRKKKSNG